MTPFIGPEQLMRESGHASLLRLGANESGFGPSPRAIEAMAAELPRLSWYGDPECFDLRSALAVRLDHAVEEIAVGSGIDDLMGLAVRAFMAPGSAVLTTRGTYPTFNYHVAGFGGLLHAVAYRNDGHVDVDALAARAHELRPSIVYLANPDNPSGTLLPPHAVVTLFERLPKNSLLLLDEAYADFVDEWELPQFGAHPRIIRLRTFSKAYGMAGARIGYAITAPRNVLTFQKIRLHYGVNRNGQIGALAALSDDEFRRTVVEQTAQGRRHYHAIAASLGLEAAPSHTNFVCINLGTETRATAVMNALLAHGVFIRKPAAPPLDRYIRVSVGSNEDRIEFGRRLTRVMQEAA